MINFVFLIVIALCGAHVHSLYVEPANRIAGGMNATVNQFPYMISLQKLSQVTNYTRGHKCGGALVTLRHAVTSASCLHEDRNGVLAVIDPKEYRVFAGATLLTNDTSEDRHRLVKTFTIHPDYSAPYENDIAIITLESEFPSNAVRTVPLAVTDPNLIQGLDCQSSGWGSQNHTSSVNIELMYTSKVVVYNQTVCQNLYSGIIPGIPQIPLGISKMCAMSTGISSSCAGDSGNPLVCSGTLNGILIVKAFNCSELGNVPRPEIYTRIASFHSWIRAMSGAATFQPRIVVLALISIVQIVTAKMLN